VGPRKRTPCASATRPAKRSRQRLLSARSSQSAASSCRAPARRVRRTPGARPGACRLRARARQARCRRVDPSCGTADSRPARCLGWHSAPRRKHTHRTALHDVMLETCTSSTRPVQRTYDHTGSASASPHKGAHGCWARPGSHLSQHGGLRGASDAPAQAEDEQRIEHQVGRVAAQRGRQRRARVTQAPEHALPSTPCECQCAWGWRIG